MHRRVQLKLVMQRGQCIARGRGADMQADGVRQMVSI